MVGCREPEVCHVHMVADVFGGLMLCSSCAVEPPMLLMVS